MAILGVVATAVVAVNVCGLVEPETLIHVHHGKSWYEVFAEAICFTVPRFTDNLLRCFLERSK